MAIDTGLRRLALGTLLAAFPGTSPPEWALDLLTEGLAGHTLFGTNITDGGSVADLTGRLRAARTDILLAIDEEGGDVTRLAHLTGSPYPGNAALGKVDDPDVTRAVYAAIGADLVTAGINLNLAPTVDVNTADDNPIIGTRSFGADPDLVSRHARAAVEGLRAAGVAACAKHFPGHGATVADSHVELPVVDASPDLLRRRDLPPFAAAIEAGTPAIMTAHIRVPSLTGDDPATFSRRALSDLLRGEYAFRGAIVTDALEMRGATASAGGIAAGAVAALAAGADLLCIGARVDRALVEKVAAEIVVATTDGRLLTSRLEDACRRTAELASVSAAPGTPVGEDACRRTAESVSRAAAPGTPAGHDAKLGFAAARRAVRVEGSLADLASPLVVQLASGHSIAEGRVPWGLRPHLDDTEQLDIPATEADPTALVDRAGSRSIVVVGRHMHRSAASRELIEQLATAHRVVVVEMGWPSSWRPANVRAFVTTYGASLANGRAAAEVLGVAGAR